MSFNFLREELPTALLSCYLRESGEAAGQKRTMLSAAELPSGGGGIIWYYRATCPPRAACLCPLREREALPPGGSKHLAKSGERHCFRKTPSPCPSSGLAQRICTRHFPEHQLGPRARPAPTSCPNARNSPKDTVAKGLNKIRLLN